MRDITVYRCDICDRSVQLQRNPHGIETVGRCIITQNCRGRLYVEDLILTTSPFISRTPDVIGLDNFFPRSKLHKFTQSFDKDTWFINHRLETFPIITVYGDDAEQTQISELDYKIDVIDPNTVNLIFDVPTSGTAELYVREVSNNIAQPEQLVTDEEFIPVSTNLLTGTFTIAITSKVLNEIKNMDPLNGGNPTVRLKFTDANKNIQFGSFNIESTNINTPWSSINSVVFKNRTYNVMTINIFTDGYNPALISNGTMLEILKPDGTAFSPNQMLSLLAKSPFELADITDDAVIEIDKINTSSRILFFDNDELVCNNNAITSTFPKLMLS